MTRYVGVDPSTKTGIVILDSDGGYIDGMEIAGKGTDPGRMIDIIEEVRSQLEPGDRIAIEGFSYGSKGRGVDFQFGLGWGLRIDLYNDGKDYIEVSPAAVKKFASGKGNTKKDELAVHIFKRWGFEHHSDNVRDAFVLAQIVRAVSLQRQGRTIALTAYQEAVVTSIINPPRKGKRGA